MKRISLFSLLIIMMLISCSIYPERRILVSFYSDSPWEEETGKPLWWRIRVFDGEKVSSFYLEEGEKSFSIKGKSGKCVLVAAYPLGSLTPFGGFWNGEGELYLYPEYGQFVASLIDDAEVRPEAVAEVDLEALLEEEPDLRSLDVTKVASLVYEGTLSSSSLPYNRIYRVPLDGILSGRWVSLLTPSETFVVSTIHDENTVKLYPGVWYYLSVERNLMLQVIVTEEGECRTRFSSPPVWY